ncbi:MAG: sulfatase, partial [Planctomycetota bacterium]
AVHQGNWKLLGNVRDTTDRRKPVQVDKLFLADMNQDIGETKNVAKEHPEVVKRLQAIMEKHVASIDAEPR